MEIFQNYIYKKSLVIVNMVATSHGWDRLEYITLKQIGSSFRAQCSGFWVQR